MTSLDHAPEEPAGWYEPASRCSHSTAVVGEELYMWGGRQQELPYIHENAAKLKLLSRVDVFHLRRGIWEERVTTGTPPLGAVGCSCAAIGSDIYFFGGYCGHVNCYHNSLHRLSTSRMHWTMLSDTTIHGEGPMRKSDGGMLSFRADGEDVLFTVGGRGLSVGFPQRGASYSSRSDLTYSNEQHMFTLTTGRWSSPTVTGYSPSPCSNFSLTPLGGKRAAMFGGFQPALTPMAKERVNDLLVVKLEKDSAHWQKVRRPVVSLIPKVRSRHAAAWVSGPVLAVVGGYNAWENVLNECWLCDTSASMTSTRMWMKLPVPASIGKRQLLSLVAFRMSAKCVWLLMFGGGRSVSIAGNLISHTAIIQLVQGGDGHWKVSKVLQEAQLSNRVVYQCRLTESGLPPLSLSELAKVNLELQQRIDMLEKELAKGSHRRRTLSLEHSHSPEMKERSLSLDRQESDQELARTKEEVERVRRWSECLATSAMELEEEKQHALQDIHQSQLELQRKKTEIVELQEELRKIKAELATEKKERKLVAEKLHKEEQQPAAEKHVAVRPHDHWILSKEEVVITSEVVGRGAYAEVKVAEFRGLRVAAKSLHTVIMSDYTKRIFSREMSIASQLRHPNLVLFIGAIRDEMPVILTELMPTSLRKELGQRRFTQGDITSISQDVACGLAYLHLWKPDPILHRDISSANVLLEPLLKGWRAKISDYGSVNFMRRVSTEAPGCQTYAAPESTNPHEQSPKMDVYSLGVLLVEMCIHDLPDITPKKRQDQIQSINWPAMVTIIKKCIKDNRFERPDITTVSEELKHLDA